MMSGGDYFKWLYSEQKERDEPSSSLESFVSGTSDMDRPKGKEDHVPKEFEGIRSWVEYSKSKTWLLGASRVSDQSNTLSALPREHQVAVPLPKSEVEKWLNRPTADALAGQLQAKLFVSSENWLTSHSPKGDADAVTAQLSAILSSAASQWLCRRDSRSSDFAKWLVEPKKLRLAPASSFDPLSTWNTFQEGINWIASPFSKDNDPGSPPMDYESDEDEDLLGFPSTPPGSLPLPFSNHQQIGVHLEKWLLPSGSTLHSSPPICLAKELGGTYNLDQWLSPSQSHPFFDQGSEASLITLGSEYELIDEL